MYMYYLTLPTGPIDSCSIDLVRIMTSKKLHHSWGLGQLMGVVVKERTFETSGKKAALAK